jgi:undecaprenyl pyrophosphate phosphatase UppP
MNILFFIQIILESLPISSSGHLYLLTLLSPTLVPLKTYEELLAHIPTLVLIIILFRKVFWGWVTTYSSKRLFHDLFCFSVATLVTVIFYALKFYLGYSYPSLFICIPFYYLPFINSLILLGLLDTKGSGYSAINPFEKVDLCKNHISIKDALWIGAFQSLALISGISRFAITLYACLYRGFSRRYSMVISVALQAILCAGGGVVSGLYLYLYPHNLSSLVFSWAEVALLFLSMTLSYILLKLIVHYHMAGDLWKLYIYSLFLGIFLTGYYFFLLV